LDSSRQHESGGRLGEALIDLDAALELARAAGRGSLEQLVDEQKKRPELARRDAEGVLDGLSRARPPAFRLGDWLNLIARAFKDPDLAPLAPSINERFQRALEAQIAFKLNAARRDFDSGNLVKALAYCEENAGLFDHLAPAKQAAARRETEEVVAELAKARGIKVEPPMGHFLFGSTYYVSDMIPAFVKALEANGYLPGRESSPWYYVWSKARFQGRLEVSEKREDSYLSSANRLTWIEVHVRVLSGEELIWHTGPTARSQVPLPKLPAYLANQVATSPERSEKFERLLYDNARDQIAEKFRQALQNMKACPAHASNAQP
jgi:hypothetical protein